MVVGVDCRLRPGQQQRESGSFAEVRQGALTLHIGVANARYVVVVGDRRLSIEDHAGLRTWDPSANKTLLVVADNGAAVVSYAGCAHIRGEPTDEWLIRVISGQVPGARSPAGGFGFRFGDFDPVRIGPMLQTVLARIDEDFGTLPPLEKRAGLQIMVTGWTWKRRVAEGSHAPRSFIAEIRHQGGSVGASLEFSRGARFAQSGAHDRLTGSIGSRSSSVVRSADARIQDLVGPQPASAVENVLAQIIRTASANDRSVGTDLMSVTIGMPLSFQFRFLSDGSTEGQRFSPGLIVSRTVIAYPLQIDGTAAASVTFSTRFGEHTVLMGSDVAVTPTVETGGLNSMGSMRRRPYRGPQDATPWPGS